MSRNQADGEQMNVIDQVSYLRFKQWGQNAKAGLDYFLNENTTIGIVYTGFWNNHHEDGHANASFRRHEVGNVYFQTITIITMKLS